MLDATQMKATKLFAALALLLGIAVSLNAQAKLPEGWKVYTVLDGKVSLAMPAEPELDTSEGYPLYTAASTAGVVVFTRQSDVAISEKDAEADLLIFFRGFRDGIVEELKIDKSGLLDPTKFKMGEEKKMTYAGLPGYDQSFTAGDVRGRFWIANSGREVYAIFCITLAGTGRPIDEIVFPSFKLIK